MRLLKSLAASAASLALMAMVLAAPASAQTQGALSVKDANSTTQSLCASTTATGSLLANCASLYVAGAPNAAGNPVFASITNFPSPAVLSSTQPINISTAATTQVVAGVSAQKIYVSSYDMIAGGSETVTWEYGTGTLCGTGTVVLTGAYPLTSQVGLAPSAGDGPALFTIPAGAALCMVTSAAVQLSGRVTYVQQ